MSVMIETIGFSMTQIFIAKDKILSMMQDKENPDQTRLMMACGNESEEWIVNESIDVLRYKYDNA